MKKFSLGAVLFVLIFAANVFAQPTWTQQTSPVTTDLNSAWAPSVDVCWMCGPNGVVVKTTNGGSTWALANSGLAGNDFYTIYAFDANNCWAGAGDGGLWHTTNGGANWSFITLTPATPFVDVVHFFDANLGFVLGDPSASQWRYYITTNGGANWTLGLNAPPSVGTEAGWNNSYAALDTGHIWWGTNVSKIYKGGFRGPFTSGATPGSANSFGMCFNNASTGAAIFQTGAIKNSVDGGATWTTGSFTPAGTQFGLKGVAGSGYMWMTGQSTTNGVIYRSTNSGVAWVSQYNITITSNAGGCVHMANINCGWVGTIATVTGQPSGKIFKYTDNVGISNQNNTPTQFSLKQNYPNPFNPTTNIDFTLAKTGYISLKIYNLLGQQVMTLIDGVETAGDHNVIFDASSLPSGTYFYTMKSGDFTATKSLVLVK